MAKVSSSQRTVAKYILFQLPELSVVCLLAIGARSWVGLPDWAAAGIIALWVVKDAVLYPFVWRAYDWDRSNDSNAMVGARGTAKEPLTPSGYVQVRGELWRAELAAGCQHVEEGDPVQVQKIDGLTLIVRPAPEKSEER